MKNNTLRTSILLVLAVLISGLSNRAFATHAAGSDIKYRCLGGLMYEVEVTFYRDCGGVAEPANITVNCKSVSGNQNFNVTANKVAGSTNGLEITVPCATSSSTCNGGSTTGIRKWVYRATVTLPSARADWVFSYNVCCRNCTITTISNPCASNSTLYVEATLNNILAPCNSSATFSNIPIAFVCIGQNFNYNHGVIDPDGDSLSYTLITPKTTSTSNVTFLAPANVNNPIASSTPFILNATTGDINFTPSSSQIGVMAILVKEYRNNQLIGSVIRDMQVYTQVCSNNLPTVSGINGTTNNTITACPGQQICFTVTSADADASQIVTMTTNNGIPGATYTIGSGSRPTLTFCWTPTLADISLRPKTFTITVRDNACPNNGIQTFSFSIYVPSPYFALSGTNVNCNGAATGAATAYPVYSGSYTYLWNNGATSSTVSGLTAGTYSVTATDPASGCSATQSVTLTEPGGMTITGNTVNPSCLGRNNGSIDVSITGGVTPYTYLWNNGATTQDLNSVNGGTYTITITDASGCTKNSTFTLTNSYAVSMTATPTAVNCFGQSTGAIAATPSGGVGPYLYSWNTGATGGTLSNITAGTYTVITTDNNGCTASASATVTQPAAAISIINSPVAVNCFGQSTGSISSAISGGTSPYTYSWNNGATSNAISNLSAGTYTITITDNKGCTAVQTSSVTQPLAAISATTTKTNINCFGQNTGSINVATSGGTNPYSYSWNNGATSQNLTNIGAGTYTVTITDAVGCTSSISTVLTEPASRLSSSVTSNNVGCFGGNSGTINTVVSGGTPAYSYLWNTGATTQNLSGISAGTYTVTVTDANGCSTVISSITISQPIAALSASTTKTNVNCYGAATGNINLSASGGTTPYTYTWSNGATTQNLSNLPAGTYTVTVKDAQNCQTTFTTAITQPTAPVSVSNTKTDIRCFGNATGIATVAASGGVSPYTYSWNNGTSTPANTNLTAGSYTATVTDANGCSASTVITLTQPAASLSLSGTATNISCFNVPTGSIAASATGGTPTYTYQWSTGSSGANINNLASGTYSVTVTDANGCTQNNNFQITQPSAALAATTSALAVGCFGQNTGSATVNITGGTSPYSYSWSNGNATATAINLLSGTYTVTATDAKGCTTSSTTIVNQPLAALTLTPTSNNIACFGNNSGSAMITAAGGTSPYSYTWNNGATTQAISNLSAGSYVVTVTDINGCSNTSTYNLTQPTASLQLAATSNDINCTGNSIGSIDLNVTGGTTPYSYQWSNGSGQQDLTNLSANTYTVTVTDANGCTSQLSRAVTQPAGSLNVNSVSVNLLCHGDNNGSINVTATAGTPPYSYIWNNGNTSEDLTNLSAGQYTVTVTDNNGCSLTNDVFVSQPTAPLSANTTSQDVACYGNSTGTIDLVVAGGTSNYSYNWSNGASTEDLSGVPSGTYSVTITDQNGCTTSSQITINQPTAALSISAIKTDLNCHDIQDGVIQAAAAGGTSTYTYTWSNGASTGSINNLSVGAYTLTVVDANGCTTNATYNINYTAQQLLGTTSTSPALCFGDATGNIDLTIQGGTPPILYKWNTGQTSEDITNAAAGTYSVVISDVNGCTTTASASIGQPGAPLASSQTATAVLCHGFSTGNIDFGVNGGTYPYTYSWSNGESTEDIQQLPAGDYVVTVTDANGCTIVNTINIAEPQASLQASFIVANAGCFGDASGSITTSVTGGTNPYTYNWNGQNSTADIQQLVTGTYSLEVIDANGCILNENVDVTQPQAAISTTPAIVNIDCNGNATGSADLQPAGGTAPYTYSWSNGQTQSVATGLQSGTYNYTITDANQCVFQGSVEITQPANSLTLNNQVINVNCFGDATGSIDLTTTGGTAGYSYLWNDGNINEDLTGLTAGTYSVTITDANNCFVNQTFTISQPSAILTATDSSLMVSCNSGQDASISLNVNGGTSPYTFTWNNGLNTSTINNLNAGSYSVLVTDANGCTFNANYTITEPAAALNGTTATTAALCHGDSTGQIDLNVSGGTAPYNYSWNNGSTTEDISALTSGTYTVLITDANNCIFTTTATIQQPAASLSNTSTITQVLCHGDNSGAISLSINGGTAPYSYAWNNGNTTQNPIGLPAGTYSVIVTDANGCSLTDSISLTEPSAFLTANGTVGHLACNGQPTGWIDLTVTGGTGPYTYQWNNGATIEDPTQLPAGVYAVIVTDNNGCMTTLNLQITQPAAFPSVSGITTPVTCTGQQNGAVQTNVMGGTSPYTYSWSTGAASPDITNLSAGIYTVTVTDANGCSNYYTTLVTEPTEPLAFNGTTTAANCITGQLGTINLAAFGGTAPYTYLWNSGANTSSLNNQIPGTYTVTVSDANGCEKTLSYTIDDNSSLTIKADGDPQICMGNSIVLQTDSVPNATLQWYYNGAALQGATSNTFVTPVAGTYTLTATTACGTYTSNPVEITVRTLSNVSINNNVIICTGESTQLQAGGGVEYTWSPVYGLSNTNISNPMASPGKTTEYTVTIKDEFGCTATASVIVTVMCDTLDIPNGFSPNNDGTNDNFVIDGIGEYPGNVLFIYNRWGNLVYKKKEYANEWDGRSNVNGVMFGDELPNGTYYYILDLNIDQKPINGFVVIRR